MPACDLTAEDAETAEEGMGKGEKVSAASAVSAVGNKFGFMHGCQA